MHVDADTLRGRFSSHVAVDMPDWWSTGQRRSAGVVVPLFTQGRLRTLVTVRPKSLSTHPGEICFPGGRPEGDESLEAAAIREADEELGLKSVELIGRLGSIPLLNSDHRLHAFVGLVPDQPLRPSPDEVEAVVDIDIGDALDAPQLDALSFRLGDNEGVSPIFELEHGVLFGASAHVLHTVLSVVGSIVAKPPPPLVTGRYRWDSQAHRPVIAEAEGDL